MYIRLCEAAYQGCGSLHACSMETWIAMGSELAFFSNMQLSTTCLSVVSPFLLALQDLHPQQDRLGTSSMILLQIDLTAAFVYVQPATSYNHESAV